MSIANKLARLHDRLSEAVDFAEAVDLIALGINTPYPGGGRAIGVVTTVLQERLTAALAVVDELYAEAKAAKKAEVGA